MSNVDDDITNVTNLMGWLTSGDTPADGAIAYRDARDRARYGDRVDDPDPYANPIPYDESSGNDSALGTVLKRSELSSLPKVTQLVDGLVSTPATVVLVGGYGVGKTFLGVSLINSVGTGHDWLGRTVQRRRSMYILGEGAYGFDHRMIAWETAWKQPVSDDDVTFIVQPNSLAARPTWDAITDMALNGGYGFIALDTFSSLAPDADETKDAAKVMRYMSNLSTAIQGTVMLIHHPGWSDSTRTRGGYQFEANADEVLVATEVAPGSDMFTILRKKVKDGPGGKVLYLHRKTHAGSCVIEESGADTIGLPLRVRIWVVLNNYGDMGVTGPQMAEELGVEPAQRSGYYKALNRLQEEEKVRKERAGGSERYFLDRWTKDE